jgi:hypothetical protein
MKYLLLLSILCLCGCAMTQQVAYTETTNPTNGVRTITSARSTTYALGDAKTIVDKVRASAGKTSSVGASGIGEETSSTNLTSGAGQLIGTAVRAFIVP